MKYLLLGLAAAPLALANFFNFFNQQQQQQQQQRPRVVEDYQREYAENNSCNGYLCPDTMVCVETPGECPCPFPDSQLKCTLLDEATYVCISKPEGDDGRDCAWVSKARAGLV